MNDSKDAKQLKCIVCQVEKIIFRDGNTGRIIMSVIQNDGKRTRLLGKTSKVDVNYVLKATGSWSKDAKYGWQFNAEFIQVVSADPLTDESEYIECKVKSVKVIKEETGFSIVRAEDADNNGIKLSGRLEKVCQGATIGVYGKWKHDDKYGDEMQVSTWEYTKSDEDTTLKLAADFVNSLKPKQEVSIAENTSTIEEDSDVKDSYDLSNQTKVKCITAPDCIATVETNTIQPGEVPAADLARFIAENTHHNLFLTGKAGTGKTVFLRDFVEHTRKKVVVLAPTGIAAINANAMTIHSFLRFDLAPNPEGKVNDQFDHILDEQEEELIRNLDMIIIDEISMVRADLMDHISEKIRLIRCSKEPFGGVQLLLIGDLYQLPPVVTKDDEKVLKDYYDGNYFFFNGKAIRKVGFETVCLDKVYRQDNPEFVNILNRARVGKTTWEDCNKLNARYQSYIEEKNTNGYISLVAQRKQADGINAERLDGVEGKAKTYSAIVIGEFPQDSYPTLRELKLKVGAQVMFVKNDKDNRYCNGTIGEIVELEDNVVSVKVEGNTIRVESESWENIRYEYVKEKNKMQKVTMGTFIQLPLKPAWAITIHKSQGLSFDHAIIDIPRAFAPGQSYVALSRCRSLEGLVLKKKLRPESFYVDSCIASFYNKVDNVQHIAKLAEAVEYKPFEWGERDEKDIKECSTVDDEDEIKSYWDVHEKTYNDAFHAAYYLMYSYHESDSVIDEEFWEDISDIAGFIKNPYYKMVLYKELREYVKEEAPTWGIVPEED